MNYVKWFRIAVAFQLLTTFIHTLSLFMKPPPDNKAEEQLFELMSNYKFDFGGGFYRSMSELTFALSACFSLVCLFGCLMNWYLMKQDLSPVVMKGILNINLVVFGVCFGLMATFTFLVPIVLTGLIFIFLVLARLSIRRSAL